jgi:hypothetical protein
VDKTFRDIATQYTGYDVEFSGKMVYPKGSEKK